MKRAAVATVRVLASMALVALPFAAQPQSGAQELIGIKTVGFLVEDPGDGGAKCGLTRQAIARVATGVIARSKLRVGSISSSDGYVYININAIYAPQLDYCAFNVAVRFNTFGDARTRYGKGYFEMTLFDRAAVGMFRRPRAAGEIRTLTGRLLTGFVEEWSRANAPHARKPTNDSIPL